MSALGVSCEGGRAETARLLDGFSWVGSRVQMLPGHGPRVRPEHQDRAAVELRQPQLGDPAA
eukprot:2592717-Alexandrium_andersonii.AAC.1